jgi:hypothetical protein
MRRVTSLWTRGGNFVLPFTPLHTSNSNKNPGPPQCKLAAKKGGTCRLNQERTAENARAEERNPKLREQGANQGLNKAEAKENGRG